MSLINTTELQCYSCGMDFSLDDDTPAGTLRQRAAAEGWTRRRVRLKDIDGKVYVNCLEDFCEDCAKEEI